MSSRLVWLCVLGCVAGCGRVGPRGKTQSGELRQGAVASVDGVAIAVSDVERLAERGSLSPQQALSRLEAEALLAAEAERRGYGDADAVQHVSRQAAVQALLEGNVESSQPSEAEIDRAYAESGARFVTPELRVASHVLVSLSRKAPPELDQAVAAYATDVVSKLRAAADPVAALDAYRGKQSQPFKVSVEDLPAVPRKGKLVEEFSAAMFAQGEPGVVPEPVRTQFGWHAIVLREIQPASRVPEAEARAQLRSELLLAGRKNRLEGLTRELQAKARISYEARTREALSALEFE
ncbi:MAG TPA: peptidylprolyl isomerase [Polyangiales bacterium]|nr:peptidylprolyl isomerase [Polyangiales bacterium]